MLDSEKRFGTVKAAIDLFGERSSKATSKLKKTQMEHSSVFQEPSTRTRELHQARSDIDRLNESRKLAESVRAQAESELSNAKRTVRDLTSRIEESNSKGKTRMQGMDKLRKAEKVEQEWGLAARKTENYQYAEVMRELEYVKQELRKLKLQMASVLQEKIQAENEREASRLRISSYSSSVKALEKEIEEVNEEQVLVELARIEAVKELEAIEAQSKEESYQFSSAFENTKRRMNDLLQEIDSTKETESKLAATTSDVIILQNELKLVKEMDQRHASSRRPEVSFSEEKELDSAPVVLQSVMEELEAAKKELISIKEESFKFMASMDVIREELKHVSQETARLKKTEEKADATVQSLNSKLLRAKAKLEAVSAAEEKAQSIGSNLSLALEQLKTESEAARKERELIRIETANTKTEVERTETEIDLAEERLQAAMQELEAVKSSEAVALHNLKVLIDNTMSARASASKHSSTITISNFEYEYLTGRAVGAEEIADKKVAAAQAWIEALKASEKEILMKADVAQRKFRELRVEEEQETYRKDKSLSGKRMIEEETQSRGAKHEKNSESGNLVPEVALRRKFMKENGSSTPARQSRLRKAASPGTRNINRSGSFNVRRRRKVIPDLAKFFNRKDVERDRRASEDYAEINAHLYAP